MATCRAQIKVYGSLSCIGASLLLAFAASPALGAPAHVAYAESLLSDLIASRQNVYGSSPSYIQWSGRSSKARTVCGTFVTNLLEHSYQWTSSTFTQWMGTTSPDATHWHGAIVAENNFTRINDISQVQPGDIIAIKYPPGSGVTGHAGVVVAAPRAQSATEYRVTVIDSSSGHHGSSDTRVTNPSTTGNGIGKGDLGIAVNSSGQPVGYTWSTESGSPYYSMAARPLAIGRVNLALFGVASALPQPHQADEVIQVPDNPPGKSDDDTLVGVDNVTGGDSRVTGQSATQTEAGGCTAVAHSQTAAALPFSLVGLVVLLSLRRRRSKACD